jgi:multidrug transporter EmrE-like cation transporter
MKMLIAMMPTVFLVVFGQLVTKWRINQLSGTMLPVSGKWARMAVYLFDPYVVTAYVASFLASIAWIFVVEKFDVSSAFPVYIGITIALVSTGGILMFHESYTLLKIISIFLIVCGVALSVLS